VPDSTTTFSREQRAAADFTNAMSHIRSHYERPEDRLSVDALNEAALRFGTCELRMRRCDRLRAVELHKAEADELAASASAENELGLAALPGVRSLIDRISERETSAEARELWREASPRLRAEWRLHVAELDIAPVEARQLLGIADDACEAADRDGFAGLGRYLSGTLTELDKVRRSEDRGTRAASFPYWKIVLAAILWGIGVGFTIDLLSRGAPWWSPYLVWLVVAVVTFIISLGC
jgi:hypothetical protein